MTIQELQSISEAIATQAERKVRRQPEMMIRCTTCGEYRLGTLNPDRPPHSVFGTCLRCAEVTR